MEDHIVKDEYYNLRVKVYNELTNEIMQNNFNKYLDDKLKIIDDPILRDEFKSRCVNRFRDLIEKSKRFVRVGSLEYYVDVKYAKNLF